MTPQERQLIADLFQRLASLENNPRDPDAEAMIREGLRRAPNAVYSLVQSVLVQDEALKAANNRIQDYEQQLQQLQQQQLQPQQQQQQQPPRGFLDSMRDSIFGRDEPRGSVPRVPQAGAPAGRPDPWGQQGYQPQGYQPQGYPPGYQGGAPMQPQPGGGGSFLGTAAAAAAGMVGGSLLMSGIRSAMAGHQGGPASRAFDGFGSDGERPSAGSAVNSDLARDAGLDDIAGGRGGGGGTQRAGLFDNAQDDDAVYDDSDDNSDDSDDGGFDSGDSDTA
jgi:uncharacterized protein